MRKNLLGLACATEPHAVFSDMSHRAALHQVPTCALVLTSSDLYPLNPGKGSYPGVQQLLKARFTALPNLQAGHGRPKRERLAALCELCMAALRRPMLGEATATFLRPSDVCLVLKNPD